MRRHFTKRPVKANTTKRSVRASYSPMLLEELVNDYVYNDLYTLSDIWEEVSSYYLDESLADDVVDAVEAEREELGIM